MPLIDKIMARVRHWTSKLLSMAGRILLVQSNVIAIIVQFWMQCIPLPKSVINKIDRIRRNFVWIVMFTNDRKSFVAWKSVCRPKCQGCLNVYNLLVGNNIAILKFMWNQCMKVDNLWVKWVHIHYLKKKIFWRQS